jgi:PhnB protein
VHLTPHLSFNGECATAFRAYQRLIGGEIGILLTYGESPLAAEVPAAMHGKILHASLRLEAGEITGTDVAPADYRKPQGFSVTLSLADLAKAEMIFHGLADGGEVHMPMQKTFWAAGFGVLVDRFGVPWEINCEGGATQRSH